MDYDAIRDELVHAKLISYSEEKVIQWIKDNLSYQMPSWMNANTLKMYYHKPHGSVLGTSHAFYVTCDGAENRPIKWWKAYIPNITLKMDLEGEFELWPLRDTHPPVKGEIKTVSPDVVWPHVKPIVKIERTFEQYVDQMVMTRLATTVYNSPSSHVTKEILVDCIQRIINEYNEFTGKNIK